MTHTETSTLMICQRTHISEGYALLSQSKRPVYFESLNPRSLRVGSHQTPVVRGGAKDSFS